MSIKDLLKKMKPKDSHWAEKLIVWADRNEISHHRLPRNEEELQQLQNLDLSGCYLTDVSESIFSMTDLTSLNLSNNEISEVPNSISSLSKLEYLNLTGNMITELPETVIELEKLDTLSLDNNPLKIFPKQLMILKNLDSIYLDRNEFLYENGKEFNNISWIENTGRPLSLFKPKKLPDIRSGISHGTVDDFKFLLNRYIHETITVSELNNFTSYLFDAFSAMELYFSDNITPDEIHVFIAIEFSKKIVSCDSDERALDGLAKKIDGYDYETPRSFNAKFLYSNILKVVIHSYLCDKSFDVSRTTRSIVNRSRELQDSYADTLLSQFNI